MKLAAGDPGLVPWVLLAQWEGPPEPVFRRCRALIDARADPGERDNLLAVTQVLAGLRYNDPGLLQILGGREAMIESPVLQELLAETRAETELEDARRYTLAALRRRFGAVSGELVSQVESIEDRDRLDRLFDAALICPDLSAFQREL